MPNFQVFDRRAVPISNAPMVTVQRSENLSLNIAAVHALGRPEFVELLYDRAERIIGIRPLREKLAHAYPLRRQSRSNTFLVASAAFLSNYGISAETSKRYVAEMFGDVLGVDLKKPGIEVTSGRSKHAMGRNTVHGLQLSLERPVRPTHH